MEFDYEEFISHNSPLLTDEAQQKIRSARLLIAGCGQGSMVAEAAVRTGFKHFVLADGDVVELSNLNRQAYDFADIGTKKVEALSRRLLRINPHCDIVSIPEYVGSDNVVSIVEQADIVVDFIDFLSFENILVLHKEAMRQGKAVVAPYSAGWGAAMIIFAPNSLDAKNMLKMMTGTEISELSKDSLFQLFQGFMASRSDIPEYVSETVGNLLRRGSLEEIVSACFTPSLASLTAAELVVAAVVRLVLGLPVKVAPEVIHFDPWVASDNS